MYFPERFSHLPAHPFVRLRALLDHHQPGGDVLHMTIGEPAHAFPPMVMNLISRHAVGFNCYPPNAGAPELLNAIADWVSRRYAVTLDAQSNLMALNGTREGLFNCCVALCPEDKGGRPVVLVPNPFYPVYAIAAAAVGAEAVFLPAVRSNGYLPDYSAVSGSILNRTAIAYICSPSNPHGSVATTDYWCNLLELAEHYDFYVFADECYAEIYRNMPPPGVLHAVKRTGVDPDRVVAFHSLSKRSNLPGLRSGFAASGSATITALKQLRTYCGAPLPGPLQLAAAEIWAEETHVEENRIRYREKFTIAGDILGNVDGFRLPEAGFFLWLPVKDGEATALALWQSSGVRVLPGSYFARDGAGGNPGAGYIRVALVADRDDVARGLAEIRHHI
ncbi:MAG: aminotransferase class I/II-fold pyridoxal phosphate-dependent enzyme [Rhodobacteraceae bacterium]|nr:aminotransferase class I/II-fold pyridoxal phosphate-dependent enzyme [Paracoccaceae bacterium]